MPTIMDRILQDGLSARWSISSSNSTSTVYSYIGMLASCDKKLCGIKLTWTSDQIRENVLVKQYCCEVDIAHLISYNEELASRLAKEPDEIIPLVRNSIAWSP